MEETLKTKNLDTMQDFMDLEEEIQQLLLKYPNLEKIDVVYKPNSISQTQLNAIEYAYSNSPCDVTNNEHSNEFESYFRLQFDKFGICTWNEITHEMSDADKKEERDIEKGEDDKQSNWTSEEN